MRLQVGVERILIDARNPLTDLPEFPLPMLFFHLKRGSELLAEYTNGDVIRYLGPRYVSSSYLQPHSLKPPPVAASSALQYPGTPKTPSASRSSHICHNSMLSTPCA